jgi:hypothetical protein
MLAATLAPAARPPHSHRNPASALGFCPPQMEAALGLIFGIDRQLIHDGT